jgi:hypothetical protein
VFFKYFKRKPAATPMPVAAADQDTVPAAFGSAANAAPASPPKPPAPPTA